MTLYQTVAYYLIKDNEVKSFASIDPNDPLWKDKHDPSGRWHNAYGYSPLEE